MTLSIVIRNGVTKFVFAYTKRMSKRECILSGHWLNRLLLLSVSLLLLTACSSSLATTTLVEVTSGFSRPLAVAHTGEDARLFVVEQTGRIRIMADGAVLATPFLDVSQQISTGGERGLLSVAFHPDYASNGRFFINYTDRAGNTVVSEFRVSDDANVADADSERVLLTFEQPYANHNGGQLAFGADGYLYIGTGDGGAANDPLNAGQDLSTLLGKLLRIAIDNANPDSGTLYAIPADNPFVGQDLESNNARPEIWAYGLRNPWRFSFDRETGDLFIADVGQNAYEEINFQPASSNGGENYGWRITEGAHCFQPAEGCDRSGVTMPIMEYSHLSGAGRSITGGYLYRGTAVSSLENAYVFGDFVSGNIWASTFNGQNWTTVQLFDTNYAIAAFGQDAAGELYLVDYNAGTLYRFSEE